MFLSFYLSRLLLNFVLPCFFRFLISFFLVSLSIPILFFSSVFGILPSFRFLPVGLVPFSFASGLFFHAFDSFCFSLQVSSFVYVSLASGYVIFLPVPSVPLLPVFFLYYLQIDVIVVFSFFLYFFFLLGLFLYFREFLPVDSVLPCFQLHATLFYFPVLPSFLSSLPVPTALQLCFPSDSCCLSLFSVFIFFFSSRFHLEFYSSQFFFWVYSFGSPYVILSFRLTLTFLASSFVLFSFRLFFPFVLVFASLPLSCSQFRSPMFSFRSSSPLFFLLSGPCFRFREYPSLLALQIISGPFLFFFIISGFYLASFFDNGPTIPPILCMLSDLAVSSASSFSVLIFQSFAFGYGSFLILQVLFFLLSDSSLTLFYLFLSVSISLIPEISSHSSVAFFSPRFPSCFFFFLPILLPDLQDSSLVFLHLRSVLISRNSLIPCTALFCLPPMLFVSSPSADILKMIIIFRSAPAALRNFPPTSTAPAYVPGPSTRPPTPSWASWHSATTSPPTAAPSSIHPTPRDPSNNQSEKTNSHEFLRPSCSRRITISFSEVKI